MDHLQRLKEKILSAPDSPGVYLMYDASGRVLYVGKAKALKKRLLSYLGPGLASKTIALMDKVRDLEFRLCPSEDMALLLEASLIRKIKPKYNVSLRDDKSFPWVKISGEDFPAIYITRRKDDIAAQQSALSHLGVNDRQVRPFRADRPVRACARYLGPYTNAKLLKNALKIIRSCGFAYRTCKRMPEQSCVYHRINLCPAPCIGKISRKEYGRIIDNIILVLEGKVDLLIRRLTKLMLDKAKARDFEAALLAREQIAVLSGLSGGPGGVNRKRELQDLKDRLGLRNLPEKIEGFDISDISGAQAVGSMVSFYHGSPDKHNYRRYRIKSFQGIDDYKMLAEVIRRRYTRLIKEKKALPDLLLIDGGKGHLLAAARQLKQLHLNLPLASIAKKEERVYSIGKVWPVSFFKGTPALNLIIRVRDEAHRFALAYHHLLRRTALFSEGSAGK